MIRVALAEDNVLLREGISRLVAANEDFDLVGVAADLPQLLALAREVQPDVVITDIRMPPTGTDEGIKAAAWLREHLPKTGVVVLSQYVAPQYALALLEQGSAGRAYLLKERVASVDELARAVRAVASGGSVIDPQVVDELVKGRSAHRAGDGDPRRDGTGQVELGDRRRAVRDGAGGGEAHQLDLREARPVGGARRQPPGQGRARVPEPHRGRVTEEAGHGEGGHTRW
jgi:DNA-binding NarL/FixJ family response regulator